MMAAGGIAVASTSALLPKLANEATGEPVPAVPGASLPCWATRVSCPHCVPVGCREEKLQWGQDRTRSVRDRQALSTQLIPTWGHVGA